MSPIKIENSELRDVIVRKPASIAIGGIPVNLYPDNEGGLVVVPSLGLNELGLSGTFELSNGSVIVIKDTLFTGTRET